MLKLDISGNSLYWGLQLSVSERLTAGLRFGNGVWVIRRGGPIPWSIDVSGRAGRTRERAVQGGDSSSTWPLMDEGAARILGALKTGPGEGGSPVRADKGR
jgi:hypothetical protein